jgi:lipooligosaccharide transport system ATP-binding protein
LEALAGRLLLYTDDGDATADAVLAKGLRPLSVLVRRTSLEDVFLRLTGRHLTD